MGFLSEGALRRLRVREHRRAMLADPRHAKRYLALIRSESEGARMERYREIWRAIIATDDMNRRINQLQISPAFGRSKRPIT